MKELYFVRHGQTEWNAIRRMQGQWNSDLSELGIDQAHGNGRFLAGQEIEHLVASPLTRTQQTAGIINEYLGLEIHLDDRIKEWDCGDWSGEMWDEVSKKWPAEFAAWQADPYHYRGPNCENYPDMIARATPFLEQLLASPFNRIAIVSHGMIGRVMVSILLNHSQDQMFEYGQANDTIFHATDTGDEFFVQHFVGGDGPFGGLPPRLY